ncbi:hypothetical protein CROQUDRAFT_54674 [Cronartium quercuum f. sp. fusiforme G11]|uniref:Uncharacterized protein n=1 Tax=Cronartium quercuum f. sp. fusiforme G11 TaxID=708437 RepID=A0A9P6N870_9BASI|nr:hypothetical protein CROQUDRAFT_54674 [Cronartium quercuum f. sp. fusiforme G11]
MSSGEPNLIVIGTLGQRQAVAINSVLFKINVRSPLDSNSWNSWSNDISLGLASAMYDSYIRTDELPEGEDENLHLVIQKCLVTWLISNMNQSESDRALNYLTSYSETGEKKIEYKPSLLWTKMREYHASQSTHKRMTLQDTLESAKQGISKDLLKHIDEWQNKLKALLKAREPISEEEKCSRLARSLKPKWREKVTDYIELGFNNLDILIAKLKRAFSSHLVSYDSPSRTEEEDHPGCGKANFRQMHCTPNRCDRGDHHLPEDCFKLPQNTHKLKEWEEEKKASGQW